VSADPSAVARIDLPASLDAAAAPALLETLLARRGAALEIDAEPVNRLGAQCLQILLSAAATWRADGVRLAVSAPSAEFSRALQLLGLSLDNLAAGEGAA
jgi:chemotaxis protein CheX